MFRRSIYLLSLALVCVLQICGNAAPEDHLILYLPFDEGSGTVATDLASGLQAT